MGSVKRAGSLVVSVVLMLAVAACNGMPVETNETTMLAASPVVTAASTESEVIYTSSPTPTDMEETPSVEPALTEEPVIEPEETEEPEPIPEYDILDIKKTGLTNEQFQKIQLMLVGISGSMLYEK